MRRFREINIPRARDAQRGANQTRRVLRVFRRFELVIFMAHFRISVTQGRMAVTNARK